jgi:hypothetical protein
VEEDLPEGIVGEVRRGLEAARGWLRRWSHGELGFWLRTCPAEMAAGSNEFCTR